MSVAPVPPSSQAPDLANMSQSAAGEEDPGSSLDLAPRSPKAPVAGANVCPKCMGIGKLASGTCPDCHGSGKLTAITPPAAPETRPP